MDHPKGLIEDYFRRYATKSDDYRWAVDYVDDLVRDDPGEALSVTIALITASESDLDLAIVSAGPLENLLTDHGPVVIARVEEESRKNDRLRLALSGVWGISPGNPIFDRWYALMKKYGFADGRRNPL